MSSTMLRTAVLVLGFAILGTPALAAVQCAQSLAGHPLRTSGGGTLFDGAVSDNASLAPDNTQQIRGTWANTWRLGQGQQVTLVCRYQGTQEVASHVLPPNVRSCRQDPSSFVCQ